MQDGTQQGAGLLALNLQWQPCTLQPAAYPAHGQIIQYNLVTLTACLVISGAVEAVSRGLNHSDHL